MSYVTEVCMKIAYLSQSTKCLCDTKYNENQLCEKEMKFCQVSAFTSYFGSLFDFLSPDSTCISPNPI